MSRFSLSAGAVTTIVFDDGGMNILSSESLDELRRTIARVPPESHLLLFKSGSARIFAAGADMREMSRFGVDDASRFSRAGQDLLDSLERLPIPTMIVIDGDCFGGALDLALSFDLIVATPPSRFSHPGARIGIVTGFGGTSRWRGRLSGSAAAGLFLSSRVMSAEEGLAIGLLDRVVLREETADLVASTEARAAALPSWIPQLRGTSESPDQHLLLLARRGSDLYSRRKLEASAAVHR